MASVHLLPAERRILKALSHGELVSWKNLSMTALGYYNKESLRVRLWRIRQAIPQFRYEVVRGVGIRMEGVDSCAHCHGTGVRIGE